MSEAKTFRTKTGYCHLLPDKIVLDRDAEFKGSVPKSSDSIGAVLLVYTIVCLYFMLRSYNGYSNGNSGMAIVNGVAALVMLLIILRSRNNSATQVIERSAIQRVNYKKAVRGLTRSYFEVFFTSAKGRSMRRMIMLPGSLSGGNTETEHALRIMREEGLLPEQ